MAAASVTRTISSTRTRSRTELACTMIIPLLSLCDQRDRRSSPPCRAIHPASACFSRRQCNGRSSVALKGQQRQGVEMMIAALLAASLVQPAAYPPQPISAKAAPCQAVPTLCMSGRPASSRLPLEGSARRCGQQAERLSFRRAAMPDNR